MANPWPVYNTNTTVLISDAVDPPPNYTQAINHQPRSSHREEYKSGLSLVCGIVLIFAGFGALLSDTVGLALQMRRQEMYPDNYGTSGTFKWAGVWSSVIVNIVLNSTEGAFKYKISFRR